MSARLRWLIPTLLFLAALVLGCRGGGVSESEIRETAEGFFRALSDDPPKAYTYFSEDCQRTIGFIEFASGISTFQGFLGESELKVKNVDILEDEDGRVVADFDVVVVANDEEIPLTGEIDADEPNTFVKEDGRWRFADCADFGPDEESGSETALPTPEVGRLDPVAVEADDDPSLPGQYIDLPRIYGGYYGNDTGPNTAAHRRGPIDYSAQGLPPAGGPHWGSGSCGTDRSQAPPDCGPVPWGIYREPWPPEALVHNMEHAGVVIWYNTADQQVVQELEDFASDNDDKLLVLAPYPDMEPETIAVTVWSRRDTFPASEYRRERLQRFLDALYCRFDPEDFCE